MMQKQNPMHLPRPKVAIFKAKRALKNERGGQEALRRQRQATLIYRVNSRTATDRQSYTEKCCLGKKKKKGGESPTEGEESD